MNTTAKSQILAKADDLVRLAQECYAQAVAAVSRDVKDELVKMGNEYVENAQRLKRNQPGPKHE